MRDKLLELKNRLIEVNDLNSAGALLYWDQSTYMPPGGAEARARQLATLTRLAHDKFIDPAIERLLEDLRPYEQSLPYDSDDAGLIRVTRREYEREVKVPSAFAGELSSHRTLAYEAWAKARPARDFSLARPSLEKMLDLSRRLAECFPGYEHIADPLIDYADYGLKASAVRATFAQLRKELAPIVRAIGERPAADDACLHQTFPEAKQMEFGLSIIRRYGYDFDRGRQDKTHHPFMTKFSLGDVRITTRFHEDDLSSLFSTMHEAGHALYEQGIPMAYEATPLAGGISMSVHESQSRLWENLVGRSRPFWEFFFPRLREFFPEQLRGVSADQFYRAINKVRRSLIRVDADEVTYNLHVMIRFELELAMLEGTLSVADLPEAWRARYAADLGVTPPDVHDGVLQDMHWFMGTVGGMFQGYTLGNVLGAQFFDAALRVHPDIPEQIGRGEFGTLHGWLKENIYRHGAKFTTNEIVERATGGAVSIEPYVGYLRRKFGEIYRV